MTNSTLLKTPEAADLLGVSDSMLEHMRSLGGGPAFIRIGRQVRYRFDDLQAFLDANTVSPNRQK
jgi:excisionase family DNA binding protein